MNIGILGFGTVGSGIFELVNAKAISNVKVIKVFNRPGPKEALLGDLFTSDWKEVVSHPDIDVVVETLGGLEPATSAMLEALRAGKSVVTANKQAVLSSMANLYSAAEDRGVYFLHEAAVGGALPLICSLIDHIQVGQVTKITGILNGTTNYILSQMEETGATFASALLKAQELGYAEADPSSDVDGLDAARKIAILSNIAFGSSYSETSVECTSLRSITPSDIERARNRGNVIRYLASCDSSSGKFTVGAQEVAKDSVFAATRGAGNVCSFVHSSAGEITISGQGAGKLATATAILTDLLRIKSGAPRWYYSPIQSQGSHLITRD